MKPLPQQTLSTLEKAIADFLAKAEAIWEAALEDQADNVEDDVDI